MLLYTLLGLSVLALLGGMWRAWRDDDNFPAVLACIVSFVAVVVFALLCVGTDDAERTAFMTECQMYHKQYECTAMWRAGEPHTTVVSMPVTQWSGSTR